MKKLLLGLFVFLLFASTVFASVTSNTSKVIFNGTGNVTGYPFTFPVYNATDLVVQNYNTTTGNVTNLTLNSNYTVTLTNSTTPNNGTVNLTSALANGTQLVIFRQLPFTQQISLSDNEATPAKTYEEGYDRSVMLSQQLQEQLNRAIIQAPNSNSTMSLPAPSANLALGWDSTGTYITNVAVGQNGVNGTNGTNGVSISSAAVNATGYLNMTLSNSSVLGPWNVSGPVGPTGPTGPGGNGSGDVLGPTTNHDLYVPQWNGSNTKRLYDGIAVGTGANDLVQLNATACLPAIDGSALTGITVASVGVVTTGTQPNITSAPNLTTIGTLGNLTVTNSIIGNLTGNVTGTASGNAAKGNNSDITALNNLTTALSTAQGGTGSVANSNAANGVVILTNATKLPALDGSLLTNISVNSSQSSKVFTVNGTFTAPANTSVIFATMVAGGGGGSATLGGIATGSYGGGSGAYVLRVPLVVTAGSNYTVTIGAAGAGSPNGNGTGGNGGNTTIQYDGGNFTVIGGYGGSNTTNGAGGNATTYVVNSAGNSSNASTTAGTGGTITLANTTAGFAGGHGAASGSDFSGGGGAGGPFGVGGLGGTTTTNATAGSGFGSGGGGGGSAGAGGGNGASGFVLLQY